jgi:dGTPase
VTGKALSNLRFPVTLSRGRRFPEPSHPYRNDFQRDRDRIVHARAFRRLEDKTQVFTAGAGDHFRNRLTHTIEVAQIARTVASVTGLDEDFTEALSLAHDVGHPPFAHAGEEELNRLMARFGDQFDHNLHSLRIVEVFEQRYARFSGLNLTFEIREGIAKHSRDFEPGEFPELDEYEPGRRPPLEAQIIDLADEIAYNTADLDDGYSAGFFTFDEIATTVPQFGQIAEAVQTMFAGAPERTQFLESLRVVIDHLVSGLIQGTIEAAQAARVENPEDIRHFPARIAALTPHASETNTALKRFLSERLYNSPLLVEERVQAVSMIRQLFEACLADPSLVPASYLEDAEHAQEPLHRRVCDYIAGMTDGYCRRVYAQIFGAS